MGELIHFDTERMYRAQEWMKIQEKAYSLAVLQVPQAFAFQQGVLAVGNARSEVFTEVEARYLRALPIPAEAEFPVLENVRIIPMSAQRSKHEFPAVSALLDIPISDVVNTKRVKIAQMSRAYVATMWPNGTMRFRQQVRATNLHTGNRKILRSHDIVPMLSHLNITPESVEAALKRLFISRATV